MNASRLVIPKPFGSRCAGVVLGLLLALVVAIFVSWVGSYVQEAWGLYWDPDLERGLLGCVPWQLSLAVPEALGWFLGAFAAWLVFRVPGFPHSFFFVLALVMLTHPAGFLAVRHYFPMLDWAWFSMLLLIGLIADCIPALAGGLAGAALTKRCRTRYPRP